MTPSGALAGMRVLDLTRLIAGSYCGMMLADLGAEVVKVESPFHGDDSRDLGPILHGESTYFANFNRNKTGITLNLKHPEGKALFLRMVQRFDVVLENFRPGTMENWGLGYDTLRASNPALVYGEVSGFGSEGPYQNRAGFDLVAQAMSGLMSVTGWPGQQPVRAGTSIGDICGGMVLTIGVLAAYQNASRTGLGQKVDVSLTDALISAMTIVNMQHLNGGEEPAPTGNRYEAVYPYDSYRTADGTIVIACGNDRLFYRLAEAMGRPELRDDPRFQRTPMRIKYHQELKVLIENWLAGYTSRQASEILEQNGLPYGSILTPTQVATDPHFSEIRQMFPQVEQPLAGRIRVTGNPVKLCGTPMGALRPAPQLGQNNTAFYTGELGLSQETLQRLKAEGVL